MKLGSAVCEEHLKSNLFNLTSLAAPELEQTMKAFHDAVRAELQDQKLIDETYQAAMNAIDHFQQAYAKGFKGLK